MAFISPCNYALSHWRCAQRASTDMVGEASGQLSRVRCCIKYHNEQSSVRFVRVKTPSLPLVLH